MSRFNTTLRRPLFGKTTRSVLMGALICALSSAAWAQEDPEDPEAMEDPEAAAAGALLEGSDGLLMAPKAAPKVLDDPDEKLLEELEAKKTLFRETLNALATASNQFAEIDKEVQKLTNEGLKAMDAYLQTHQNALEAYRKAVSEADEPGKKKHGAEVVKARKTYLATIVKVQKGADKLKEKADKLQKKIDSGRAVLAEEGEE